MKRAIALLLAAAMVITILASCGTNEKQAYLNAMLEGTGFSGVVLVTKNVKTVCEAAKGTENKFSNKKITADTKFCIGSVSKQFAAAAILLLRQDGQLSVDDKLSKYFPDYRYGNELTIRHLLDMRSGIREFYDVEYIDDAFTELPTGELRGLITNDNTVEENREILEDWLLRQPLEFEPDTAFEYSNSNYFLLARIVEIVSGQSYNEFLREIESMESSYWGKSIKSLTILGNHDLYNNGWENWKAQVYPYTAYYSLVLNGKSGGSVSLFFLDSANGTLGVDQLESLESEICADVNPKIVFSHYPVYAGGNLLMTLQDTTERSLLLTWFSKNNVRYVFAGHAHKNYGFSHSSFREDVTASYVFNRYFRLVTVNTVTGNVSSELLSY